MPRESCDTRMCVPLLFSSCHQLHLVQGCRWPAWRLWGETQPARILRCGRGWRRELHLCGIQREREVKHFRFSHNTRYLIGSSVVQCMVSYRWLAHLFSQYQEPVFGLVIATIHGNRSMIGSFIPAMLGSLSKIGAFIAAMKCIQGLIYTR